jgi:hypothetical protein
MKRSMSRARGSSSMIRKRTSHIRIILTDEIEIQKREKSRPAASGAKKKSKATRPTASKAQTSGGSGEKPAAQPAERKAAEHQAEPAESVEHKEDLGGGPGSSPAAPKVSSDEDVSKT